MVHSMVGKVSLMKMLVSSIQTEHNLLDRKALVEVVAVVKVEKELDKQYSKKEHMQSYKLMRMEGNSTLSLDTGLDRLIVVAGV